MSIYQSFEKAAANYDAFRTALIPDYDAFYGAAVAALPADRKKAYRILDLGAGTGAFAELVSRSYPHARIIVSDFSEAMLEQAQSNLRGDRRFTFERIDMLLDPLPADLDIVVSSLAIHHFDHADKRLLFSRIARALKPGGVFVNADQMSTGDDVEDKRVYEEWLSEVRASGITAKELKRVTTRMHELDQNAPAELQVRWLMDAGFEDAQVCYQAYFWAVFRATR